MGDGILSNIINISSLDDSGWSFVDDTTQKLLAKLKALGRPLSEYDYYKEFEKPKILAIT